MKNKREKKKMGSRSKAMIVFLCFVLTIFFIALKGFSHSSEEDSRFSIQELNSHDVGVKSPGDTERLGFVDKHQSANGRSKTSSGGYLTEVGVWGYGPCHASFVLNDRLYMGTGRNMVIYDISSPPSPVKLGDVTLSSMVNSIYVDGNYAYTAVSFGGFQVVDISNPGLPVVIGSFDTSGNSKDIYIGGSHAYVADYDRGLRIVDISNPSSPIEIGFFQTSGYAHGVHVLGNFAYVANWSNGLRIIDISNPTAPFETGYYDTEDWALGVYVSGSYAYVADNNSGLRIIDVSVPQSPVEVGYYYDYYHDAKDVYVSGIYAYTAGGYDGMRIIDVSNPMAPSLISHLDTPESALNLSISGNYSYLTNGYSGLFVIDISTISSPIEVAHIEAAGRSFSVFVSDSYAYIANEKQGLRIIDISNLSLPTEMAYLDTNYALDVYMSGSYAYIADNLDGMRIFDVSNPAAPIETGLFLSYASGVFVSDNLAYIADYNSGLIIVDITNPNSPTEVGSCVWPQPDSKKVYVSGNYAYIADGDNGIKVINISNPTAPFQVGELNTAGYAQDIHVLGSYAYVADSWNGLRIIYVENPGNPVEVGFYDTPDLAAMGVYVVGSHVFVSAASYGLYVIDVSDPMSPLEVDSFLALHYAKDVFVEGEYAYVADSEGGMPIIDVKNYIPSINISSPNGGESWEVNSEREIKWISYVIPGNVSIDYTYDGGLNWIEITDSTENDGSFLWTIPQNVSANCMVRISNSTGTLSDTSDGVFSILEPKAITVTAPNGSEYWEGGTSQNITWNYTGEIDDVIIEYSTNNGSSWNTVISSTGNSGIYNWTIPNNPSANCLVRVSDTAGPAADTSNSVFTIDPFPTITVSAPNGGETWEAYTVQTITWSSTGTVTNVSIDYSTNGGSSWNAITTSTANTGSFNWTIPYIESNNCLVRVSDLATAASDTSDGVFTMILPPSITVTSPNGGESWPRRSDQTITWTSTGNVGNVDIRYSTDGGSTWELIVSSTTNSGSYQWSLPNVSKTASECLVRLTAVNGSAEDTSDAFFTIQK